MARIKGSKNKRTILREAAAAARARGLDAPEVILDSLAMMEKAMRYFDGLAEAELKRGKKCDPDTVGKYYRNAAAIAEKIAVFRHPRFASLKVERPPERSNITKEELRAEIIADMERLGLETLKPKGIANQSGAK